MSTPVAVSTPALVTRNGAVDAVEDPAKNGNEAGIIPAAVAPDPAVREVELIVKPPICPDDADTAPAISTPVAVRAPVLVTLNGAVDAVDPPSHKRYAGSLDDSRAILEPVPSVMSPVAAMVVSPPVSDVDERLQPPTVPPVAVMSPVLIVPVMFALVAVSEPVLVTLNGAVEAVEPPSQSL